MSAGNKYVADLSAKWINFQFYDEIFFQLLVKFLLNIMKASTIPVFQVCKCVDEMNTIYDHQGPCHQTDFSSNFSQYVDNILKLALTEGYVLFYFKLNDWEETAMEWLIMT